MEPRNPEYVLLASLLKAWEHPGETLTLVEVHALACVRVAEDAGARVITQRTGDAEVEARRITRVVGEADEAARKRDPQGTTADIIAALASERVDARCVTDDSGAYVELVGYYVGRCLRGRREPCFPIVWADAFGNLRGDTDRP